MSNLLTNRQRLFELMADGKWHDMDEMQRAGGWRYGARLQEIEEDGWRYEKRTLGQNVWAYRLIVEARQLAMEVR